MRTRLKICGITQLADLHAAVQVGADAIGFVFVPESSRAVQVAQAQALCRQLPPFIDAVGLFVDADPAFIRHALEQVPLDLLQFHGQEPPAFCDAFERPYIKAVAMPQTDLHAAARAYHQARALLCDSHAAGQLGGTGQPFDWDYWPTYCEKPLILAGGLQPTTVFAAVTRLRPYAVDVSSGVEGGIKGVKDHTKLQAFAAAVRQADRQLELTTVSDAG